MIDIRPAPEHPHGGYARLCVPSGALPQDSVSIDVLDKFREHFLGPDGFQPHKFQFGPYPVIRDGEQAHILVGPEIVNHIEEYASLTLTVGPVSADVSWPDDVLPLEAAPALGGIKVVRVDEAPAEPVLSATRSVAPPETPPPPVEPVVKDEPAPPPAPAQPEPEPEPEPQEPEDPVEPSSNGLMMWLVAAVILAAIVGGGWWVMQQDTPGPAPTPAPVAQQADPCSLETLRAADAGTAVLTQLRGCLGTVSADDALLVIEASARAGTAEALTLMGKFYDDSAADQIKTETGLRFSDDPARAAEYYRQAVDAGGEAADALLAATCERLQNRQDTLSQSAIEEYCP